MAKAINEILQKYYDEAVGGIVQKAPSALNRGEGTEIEYYIYKIDLVSSTLFIKNRTHQTYLKLAHTFLSTVDEITRDFGADGDQTEYAGDGIIAYFRVTKVEAIDVLHAAYFCRLAALEMKKLNRTLGAFPFRTKSIIHFGKLIMAKIGPRGNSMVSAIGPALHKACKMENKVLAGEGRTSKEFRDQLKGRQRIVLKGNYTEMKVLKEPEITPNLRGLILSGIATPAPASNLPPQYEIKQELADYSIQWDMIPKYLGLPRQ